MKFTKKYKEGDYLEDLKTKYKILSVENNKDNGMQAMAVAPVDSKIEIEIFKKLNNQIKRV